MSPGDVTTLSQLIPGGPFEVKRPDVNMGKMLQFPADEPITIVSVKRRDRRRTDVWFTDTAGEVWKVVLRP